MRGILMFLAVICFIQLQSQSFKGQAKLAPVDVDGFYNVLITPEINAYLNDDLSDIRIFDARQKEVPYLFQSERPTYNSSQFMEYEIIKKDSRPSCCTSILLRNKSRTPINNIHLIIKNAEARREASLLGSDDNKSWFAIKDHFILDAPRNDNGTQELEMVGFPWTNYEYYQIKIADSTNAPLNVLKAGYYVDHSSDGKFTRLPVKVDSYDSTNQKKTYVKLVFNTRLFVDKLDIDVSGVRYYRRKATLFEKRIRKRNGGQTEYFQPVQSFELTTGRRAILELSKVRGREFLIEIENGDNPPLSIASAQAFQLNRYLSAWLNKDVEYSIHFGHHALSRPSYDLVFFRDSIPDNLKILQPREIKLLGKAAITEHETFFTSKSIIWAAIIVVMLILGYMSVKLIRESAAVKPEE
ncbi:MAG TPA: hypothetical protein VFZ52_11560 [Chryseolinea sp.]